MRLRGRERRDQPGQLVVRDWLRQARFRNSLEIIQESIHCDGKAAQRFVRGSFGDEYIDAHELVGIDWIEPAVLAGDCRPVARHVFRPGRRFTRLA